MTRIILLLFLGAFVGNLQANKIDALFLNSSTTLDVISEKRIEKTRSRKIKIFSNEGDRYAQLAFLETNFQSMKNFDVSVFNAKGQLVRQYHKNDFDQRLSFEGLQFYNDNQYYSLDVSINEHPYTIEYSYTLKLDFIFDFKWTEVGSESVPVAHSDFTFSQPSDMEVNIYFDSLLIDCRVNAVNGTRTYYFEADSPVQPDYESFSPSRNNAMVELVFQSFNFDGYEGSLASWEEFGKWMNDLWANRTTLHKKTLSAIFPNGYSNLSPEEKARKAYEYIQKNMRYVAVGFGAGGLQTMSAEETFKNGYGDCKALSNFMHAVLAEVGVESYPTLVSAGLDQVQIYPDRPTNSFNHVILCIPSEEDTMWLECTSNRLPFNYLSDFTDDRYVMLMTQEGGKLVRTPKYSDNVSNTKLRIALHENGSAEINYEATFRNLAIDGSAFYFKEIYGWSDEKVFSRASRMKSFEIEDLKVELYPNAQPRMEVRASINNRLYAKRMGNKMLIKPLLMRDDFPEFEKEERANPVYFKRGFLHVDTIRIKIPQGMTLHEPMENKSLNEDFGTFELKSYYNQEEAQLSIVRELSYLAGEYPRERYFEIKTFFDAVSKVNDTLLIIVPE